MPVLNAGLSAQTNMAQLVVSMKIMPESPQVKLEMVEEKVNHLVREFGGNVGKVEFEPIAFGLKAMLVIFLMDESLGSTDALEENVEKLDGVQSAEVTDVRRAIG
ncbi:MAG: elongation factor 1-beta [Candidatus Woesearchaeota archaeon]